MLLKKKIHNHILFTDPVFFFLCGMCILQLPYSHSAFPQATVAQQWKVWIFSLLDFLSTRVLLAVNYNLAQVQVSDDIIAVGS